MSVSKCRLELLGLCLLFGLGGAEAAGWKEAFNESGVSIQQQDTPSGYAITRGSKEIGASLATLVSILRAPGVCKNLIFSCKDGWVVEQINQKERLDYTIIDAPLLLEDRDIYVHSHASWDSATKTVLIRLSGHENHDAGQPKRVRVKDFQGYWRFQQLAAGKVQATYQVYSDPQITGGTFFNGVLVESVFETLQNLDKLSKQPKYKADVPIESLM